LGNKNASNLTISGEKKKSEISINIHSIFKKYLRERGYNLFIKNVEKNIIA